MSETKYINPYKQFLGCFVPNWLMKQTEISFAAKLCYGRLAQYAGRDGECYPSQETLADDLGTCERNVRSYIADLKKAGLIEVERTGSHSRMYRFLEHAWMDSDRQIFVSDTDSHRQDPAGEAGGHRQDPAGVTGKIQTVISISNSEENHRRGLRHTHNRMREGGVTKNGQTGERKPAPPRPPTREEVITQGSALSPPMPKRECEKFFLRYDGAGWIDGAGQRVGDWQSKLEFWWLERQDKLEKQQRAVSAGGTNGTSNGQSARPRGGGITIEERERIKQANIARIKADRRGGHN